MKSICLIPARGGSKRVVNKNILRFNNKLIIFWSIQAAIKSKCFDKIVISTDSEKIIKIAKKLKIEFVRRPKSLANDRTPLFEVVRHFIKNIDQKYTKVCCILPCSPLIFYKDIIYAKKQLNKKTKFIFPITNYSYPIDRSLVKNNKNYINFKNKNVSSKNTQDFNDYFHDAGQFYWGFREDFLKFKNIFESKKVKGYFIPNYRVKDIDNQSDLKIAKNIFKSFFN